MKPLPPGAPPGFSAVNVGHWDLSTEASESEVELGQPVTVKVILEGRGNLHNVVLPPLTAPEGLKVYDPTPSDKFSVSRGQVGGRQVREYLVMPQQTGTFTLPGALVPVLRPGDRSLRGVPHRAAHGHRRPRDRQGAGGLGQPERPEPGRAARAQRAPGRRGATAALAGRVQGPVAAGVDPGVLPPRAARAGRPLGSARARRLGARPAGEARPRRGEAEEGEGRAAPPRPGRAASPGRRARGVLRRGGEGAARLPRGEARPARRRPHPRAARGAAHRGPGPGRAAAAAARGARPVRPRALRAGSRARPSATGCSTRRPRRWKGGSHDPGARAHRAARPERRLLLAGRGEVALRSGERGPRPRRRRDRARPLPAPRRPPARRPRRALQPRHQRARPGRPRPRGALPRARAPRGRHRSGPRGEPPARPLAPDRRGRRRRDRDPVPPAARRGHPGQRDRGRVPRLLGARVRRR